MQLRTRKAMNINGLTTLLDAVPSECRMKDRYRHITKIRTPAGIQILRSYDDSKAVVANALSKLTADEIEALEQVMRDLIHAQTVDFEAGETL